MSRVHEGDPEAVGVVRLPPVPAPTDSWHLFGVGVPVEHRAQVEARFGALCEEVLAGRRPWACPELRALAHALKLDAAVRHDRRPPVHVAPRELPDALLAELTEDFVPDAGVLLGAVSAGWSGVDPVVAAGVLAFTPTAVDGRRPVDCWDDEEERDRVGVVAVRVLDASPPGVFVDGVSLLPRPPRWQPTGPAPAGVVVARPWKVEDNDTTRPWRWSCVQRLPAAPDPRVLWRRMVLEVWRARLGERRMSFEDLLRQRPEVLYRAAIEGSLAAPDGVRTRTRHSDEAPHPAGGGPVRRVS